ncbi:hypothetical protein FGG08_004758 [Glutinoglossum americanum]|uniref:protein-ribulosamine 3-kinase n=1 Tax=Glutinoglossum americanum TaxID=1670608 RepID=A0A9P8HVV4_9PEZI|nr:hypothetical protein FGG08_004758 [Glutinoglossum americanum]
MAPGRDDCGGRASGRMGSKRKAEEELEAQFKKARLIPTPDAYRDEADRVGEDAGSLDGGDNCTEGDNRSDKACSEKSDVLEMLTPSTPSVPSTPKPKYASETRKFPCTHPDCPKLFNRPAKLADHMRSHSGDRPFECTYDGCDKSFTRRTSLKDHIQCIHTRVKDHACQWEGCGKRFRTATKLKNHIAIHEGHERFRCTGYPPCNEFFRKHQTLHRHIASVHLGQMPYPCAKIDPITNKPCTEGFKQAGHLRTHVVRYHSGIRFWCHECKEPVLGDEGETAEPRELGFHTYELFEQHKRLVHPPNCTLCSKVCSTQSELRRHIEVHHSDIRPEKSRAYRCQATGCDREFAKRSNLKVHVRSVHEHIRPFVCGVTDLTKSKATKGWDGQGACGSEFAAKRALEEHVRIRHMELDASRRRKTQGNEESRATAGQTAMGSSMIARLTGVGYEESRHIPCLYPSCQIRFTRQYDLELHMKTKHHLSDGETVELFVEKEALNGGRFWFGADVQDEEYWDWAPEAAEFDPEDIAEDEETPSGVGRAKRRGSVAEWRLGGCSRELGGEGVLLHGEDIIMDDQGAGGEILELFQCAIGDSGKAQMEGEFNAMSELYKTIPSLVPKPYAWGKRQLESPATYFFLCEFVNISDRLPDPAKLGACLAELHKKSVSPTGKFGFHVPTYDGKLEQVVDWDSSWPSFFGKLLAGVLQSDIKTNGPWEELEVIVQRTLSYVIPRLLGALETDGRTVEPCLIHGDLWEGNIGTEFGTGNIYIFDSCAFYAHHEMEIGIWRVEHHRMKAKAYKREYLRNMDASEPIDEFDDRNRLYSVKTKLMYSAHVPGTNVRQQAYEDLCFLVDKYAPWLGEGKGDAA